MKTILIFLSLFSFPLWSHLSNQDDTAVLNELIAVTEKTLAEQKELLQLLTDFKKKREEFIGNPESAKLATSLVRCAQKLEKEIEKDHLAHLLSEDLLTEVSFFSKVGN